MPEHGIGGVWSLARLVLAGRWRRVIWVVGLSVANGLFQGAVVVLLVSTPGVPERTKTP